MRNLIHRAFSVAFLVIAVIAVWGAVFRGASHHFITAFICTVIGVILTIIKDE